MNKDVKDVDKKVVEAQTVSVPAQSAIQPRSGIEANRGYVKISRGYPVQPGQTWHDLTMAQRQEWFRDHENRWKKKFMDVNTTGQMNWTRG